MAGSFCGLSESTRELGEFWSTAVQEITDAPAWTRLAMSTPRRPEVLLLMNGTASSGTRGTQGDKDEFTFEGIRLLLHTTEELQNNPVECVWPFHVQHMCGPREDKLLRTPDVLFHEVRRRPDV